MSIAIANLQKQKQKEKEEVRARLLADEAIRSRIAFRAFEIYQRHGDGHGGALTNWLQAEDEIVSSLVEQELQLSSVSAGRKGHKDFPKASVKPEKKSPSRAASVSVTASKHKTKTKQAAPTSAESAKNETKPSRVAKRASDASARKKERSKPESQLA